jgi:hypothetical protein
MSYLPEDVTSPLENFRYQRLNHEAARKYTVTVDGREHNAGEFRDNMADVLEELSDAHNIAHIALTRLMRDDPTHPNRLDLLQAYIRLVETVESAMVDAVIIRYLLPDDLKMDDSSVLGDKTPKRIVTLAEVGL